MYQASRKDSQYNLGVIGDCVVRLCSDIQDLNHKIFMDNHLTSIPTIKYLKDLGIYVVGTVRINIISKATNKLVDGKFQMRDRGSCSVTTSSDNITILRWADNNIVHM